MSITIHTNVPATRAHGVYNRNNNAMNEAMTRVATGQKINSAKDGASVYAISERMRNQIRANDQANQNTQNDSALLKTAQGGISNTISILNTLKERAINSANDSNLNTNRSDIAEEVYQLVNQIDDNANKVKFNGRTLLNGAVDSTVGKLYETGAVADSKASTTANPTSYSSHAVYSLTGLNSVNASSAIASVSSTTKLVSLVEKNSSSTGDTILSKDDKITFSWKENGATVKKEITVDNNMTLASLASKLNGTGSLKATWYAAAASITSGDTNSTTAGTNDAEKNIVLDASTFDQLKASKDGLYVIGKKDVAITDFSVSVTHKSTSGENINSAAAQETLSLTGVQQSFGASNKGSNVVLSSFLSTSTSNGIVGMGEDTKLSDLLVKGSTTTKALTSTTTKVGITINGGTEFFVNTGSSIKELNEELKKQGYDVQAVLLNKGDNVTYNGLNVTRGSGDNETALKATASGLFFVGAEGDKSLDSVTFKTYKNDGSAVNGVAENGFGPTSAANNYSFNKVQTVSSDAASGSKALTFFVGGEPNFGIDVTINKMTSGALLKSDASDFAEKFLTKEGAQSALTVIDNALNRALNEQTKLGAMEARLGYTSDNLTTMNENLEASDSVMRDSDVAKEMTNYMKYSVLSQAAQYMLAQAGQNAFSVLNLLQA